MIDEDNVKEVLSLFVFDRAPKVNPDIDYTKDFEIMCEKTGRQCGEEMRFEGKPIVENGRVVGGMIKGVVCYTGYGTSAACETKGMRLSRDEWIKFVNKSVKVSERREKERVAFEKKLEKERVIAEYRRKHPVATYLQSYLREEDEISPVDNPNYKKSYMIDTETGRGYAERLNAEGKPIIENGEVVGGLISAKISQYLPYGGHILEHPQEEVSLECWKAFVHKSIKVNHEKSLKMARIYGKSK